MNRSSLGELVKQAKGEDRSLREYARDSGVDAAILSKMINGAYIPKKPGIYVALTSPQAYPRGGVTCEQMMAAAGAAEEYRSGMSAGMSAGMHAALADIPSAAMIKVLQARGIDVSTRGRSKGPSSAMKPEEIRRILALAGKLTGKEPLLSEFNIYMLNRNNEFDCSKAERELGFHCRPFSESIRDTVIWLRKEGFLAAEEKSRVVDIGLADLLLLPVKKRLTAAFAGRQF